MNNNYFGRAGSRKPPDLWGNVLEAVKRKKKEWLPTLKSEQRQKLSPDLRRAYRPTPRNKKNVK